MPHGLERRLCSGCACVSQVWRRDFCLYEFNQHELLSMVLADEHNPFSTGERAAMWFTKVRRLHLKLLKVVHELKRSDGRGGRTLLGEVGSGRGGNRGGREGGERCTFCWSCCNRRYCPLKLQ